MSEPRQTAFTISVGTNGTGKTTQLKELLGVNERNLVIPSGFADTAWLDYKPLTWKVDYVKDDLDPKRKVRRIVIPELNTFTGTRVLNVDGETALWDAVIHPVTGLRDAGFFPDDFGNYALSKGTLKQNASALFRSRRHKMLDIFMACHGFEDISRDLLRFNPTLFIFKTTLPPNEASVDKMHNRDEFLATIARVNERAAVNPYYFESFSPAC